MTRKIGRKISHLHIHEDMHLPHSLTFPISTHNIAQSTPITEIKNNPLLLPALLLDSAPFPTETFVFLTFILTLLKLDIRSKARFTNAFSEADAGVVGIDSTNDHNAEENRLAAPTSSLPFSF